MTVCTCDLGYFKQLYSHLGHFADTFVQSTYKYIHSYTDGGGCYARCRPAHLEQFGVQYLAQGHFDMKTREIGPATFR